MNEKPVPTDASAERSVIGAIFLDREAIFAVEPWLEPAHFFPPHQDIYKAQLSCYRKRVPPDLVNVADELRRAGKLDRIGGAAYLLECVNATPAAVHVEYYGRIVRRTALYRKLIQAGDKIARLGYGEGESIETVLAAAEAELAAVVDRSQDEGFEDLSVVVGHVYEAMIRMRDQGLDMLGVPSGFRDLDDLTGGWQKSDLIILAARPAVGKTSLALAFGDNAAQRQFRVAFESLEMNKDQLVHRLLATKTGMDVQKLRQGKIADADLQILTDAMGVLSTLPLSVDAHPSLSIQGLRSRLLRLQAEKGLDLVIVDYLQLLHGEKGDRYQEVSGIARGLKELARELHVPIIALSQLSRAVEGRLGHVPMLSDLRESGEIEQAADIVMFIYREELYDVESDKKGIAEVHIAKHRNGPAGIVPMRFFSSTTRFADLERYRQPEGY